MASVSVKKIPAFDAEKDRKISFSYSGNQCIGNQIAIYNSSTNALIYSNRISTFALSQTIPAGTLENGVSYYIKITAYYMDGPVESSVVSTASNVFKCLSTPEWGFSGIGNNYVVNNSSIDLSMVYAQAQNEEINEFFIEVYTGGRTLFHRSDSLYNVDESYTVSGLADNSVYYLRAYGVTVNGLVVDTRDSYPDDVKITVDFISPDVYSYAYLENLPDKGVIRIAVNIASIEGHSQSGKELHFINDEYIDLTDDSLIFDSNIYASDNYTFLIKGKNFGVNSEIFRLSSMDASDAVSVVIRESVIAGNRVQYGELRHTTANSPFVYVIHTNFKAILPDADIQILIKRENGLFYLEIYTDTMLVSDINNIVVMDIQNLTVKEIQGETN